MFLAFRFRGLGLRVLKFEVQWAQIHRAFPDSLDPNP